MEKRARMVMGYISADGYTLARLDEVFVTNTYAVKDEGIPVEVYDLYQVRDLHGKDFKIELKGVPASAVLCIPEPIRAEDVL